MKTASMTQQQKREKAAELLGWKRASCTWILPDDAGSCCDIPLYDEDLNLMHEAKKVMTDDQHEWFTVWLGNIVLGHGSTFLEREEIFKLVSATAAQRLDAWLEVMMEGES